MTLEQIGGAGLMLLFLADIFLTILYARAGTGLLSPRWNRLIWSLIKGVAGLFGRGREKVLSFGGPLIVISLIAFWALGLTLGAALLIRPELGVSIRPGSGDTPTDFVTAMMAAGNSLSIVGSGDYSPHSTGTRLLYLINSFVGGSVMSLVLIYLMQIYNALRERNSLALTTDLMTGGTGDAAEMLARLGPEGDFSDAASKLGNLMRSLVQTKEAHHFYPLLFYFRFEEPLYSVPRVGFILLDLTTLIDTTLDREKHGAFLRSAPVEPVRACALMLLKTLDRHASAGRDEAADAAPYDATYATALTTLRRAGIEVRPDGESYRAHRAGWEPLVRRVAPTSGHRMNEIDCRQVRQ